MEPNPWTAGQVMDCYRQASLCADATAYWQVVTTDPLSQRGEVGLRSPHDPRAGRLAAAVSLDQCVESGVRRAPPGQRDELDRGGGGAQRLAVVSEL